MVPYEYVFLKSELSRLQDYEADHLNGHISILFSGTSASRHSERFLVSMCLAA